MYWYLFADKICSEQSSKNSSGTKPKLNCDLQGTDLSAYFWNLEATELIIILKMISHKAVCQSSFVGVKNVASLFKSQDQFKSAIYSVWKWSVWTESPAIPKH